MNISENTTIQEVLEHFQPLKHGEGYYFQSIDR